jgi:hypothetical protein
MELLICVPTKVSSFHLLEMRETSLAGTPLRGISSWRKASPSRKDEDDGFRGGGFSCRAYCIAVVGCTC